MDWGIGLVSQRADVTLHVADLATSAGARVVPVLDPAMSPPDLRILLVDGGVTGWPDITRLRATVPSAPLTVVHLAGESTEARTAAGALGADHVIELPRGVPWLRARLLGPARTAALAVLGSVGGVGATAVAIACAAAAAQGLDGVSDTGAGSWAPDGGLLVDADPWSAGLDLPLGIPEGAGGRWAVVPDTAEPLVAESLRAALPRVRGVTVATGPMPEPAGARVTAVVDAGRSGFRRTVIDGGRGQGSLPLGPGDAAVVVTPATLAGVVSSRRLISQLPTEQVLLAVRATAWLPVDEVAEELGVGRLIEVPRMPRLAEAADCGEVLSGRVGRDLVRLGGRIWQALP